MPEYVDEEYAGMKAYEERYRRYIERHLRPVHEFCKREFPEDVGLCVRKVGRHRFYWELRRGQPR